MSERQITSEFITDQSAEEWISEYLVNQANPEWIKSLSPQQMRYLTLRLEMRKTNAEIAEILGKPENRQTHKNKDTPLTRAGTRFIRESIFETIRPFINEEDTEAFFLKWNRATTDNVVLTRIGKKHLNRILEAS